jgi:hypothetical protein
MAFASCLSIASVSAKAIGPVIIRERCQLVASGLMRFLEILKAAAAALSADGDELTCDRTTASRKRRDKASAG